MTAEATAAVAAPRYTRANPFPARLVVNRRLSGPESAKDTRHFELDLTGWGLSFEVGDSLAVYATNDPQLVDEIIHALGATGDEEVPRPKGPTTTFREALLRDYGITQPTPKFLKATTERANSLNVYPEQVHFIVDVIRYESHGRIRKGVASSFLAERADDVPVPVYPSVAKHFHLPENPYAPIIMVGPGTGVAPFRAYLQERKALGAKGKNWLFFGSQHERCDFAYGDEFEAFKKEGILTRLDCAWSRDQPEKIYVQHRMRDNAGKIWKWLDAEGAHFFVCGDARRMAKDVDATLRKIVQEQGGKSIDEANEYVEKLKSDKRYKRDVY